MVSYRKNTFGCLEITVNPELNMIYDIFNVAGLPHV